MSFISQFIQNKELDVVTVSKGERYKMINTNYATLDNKVHDPKQQIKLYQAMNVQSKDASVQKETTNINNSGVILTLSTSSSVLQVGSRGDEVKQLQENLTKLGYDTKGTDGIFGSDTESAVRAFQKAYGLTVDGKVGSATQSAIGQSS
ncbi:MAG: peptidoglycan-binding protein [Acetatifactor sp.]|nr:peptidoglycan-binding protein [Acetatifactor sp.]